ncbi:MAG: Sec-independent protein translocase subunit TatA/TatB [Candidatus Poseidoniaceae archaeon]
MASIGGPEVLIIIVVFFVLFGARRLPELANALGRSKGEFQKGLQEATSLPREVQTIADLEAGGMTPDVALVERAKALGLDPSGMSPEDLQRKVEALEQAEE